MAGLVLLLIGLGGSTAFALLYTRMEVPNLARLRAGYHPSLGLATIIYSADGLELTRYYRENRTWISYHQLSPALIEALIATEDRRFYAHSGVDWLRMVSSLWKTAWGDWQGGSTITMQLARNYFPDIGAAPVYRRKLYEIATALKTERVYLKHEIIEMYLNTVPFGYQTFGIETAARTYFNKSASDLNVVESATLVGMLKGITRYNPVRNPELSRTRRNVVLGQMVKFGSLDPAAFEQLSREPLALDFHYSTPATGPAPHFAEYVRSWLDDWASRQGYDLYVSGLKVYTTLDTRVQALAAAAVEKQMNGLQAVADYEWSRPTPSFLGDAPDVYERARAAGRFKPFSYFKRTRHTVIDQHIQRSERYQRALRQGTAPDDALRTLYTDEAFMDSLITRLSHLETGLVAIDPTNGHIKAWIGGRDFGRDQYDKVALAQRQPGSTFKPFVYAAALELGYSPMDQRIDEVRTYETSGSDRTWTPGNAGEQATGDTLTLREGLAYSKNTITAQIMDEIGPNWVAHIARQMGIRSPLNEVPSLALGTSEVTLLELAAAYSPLANQGQYHLPLAVTRIEDRNGRLIASFASEPRQAVKPTTAYNVLEMMRAVVDEGTGVRIRSQFGITADVAGKTGTTQNNADGWFILMHPRLIVGAWVGFNDRQITFRSNFWGQGGHNALYVVGDFFKHALAANLYRADLRFEPPPGYQPPIHPDSLAADAPRLYTANLHPEKTQGAASPADVEGTLRTVVSHSLRDDAARAEQPDTVGADLAADTAFVAEADSTRPVRILAPIDTARHHRAPAAQTGSDTDIERAMRSMLFPDAPENADTSRTRRDRPRGDQYR